jgi:hypothetical protein
MIIILNKRKLFLAIIKLYIFMVFPAFSFGNYYTYSSKDLHAAEQTDTSRVKNSGLFAIWYGNQTELLSLPGVIGGQVVVQWNDVEPDKNNFDFSAVTSSLNKLKSIGKLATVQINGSNKPDYLFNEVPWVEEKLHHSIKDTQGTLMYWHPAHQEAYTRLLQAFGDYLSLHKGDFLGVRLNFNLLGTEIPNIPYEYRDASVWNYPEGVEPGKNWTNQVSSDYKKAIVDAYIKEIVPNARVFLRNDFKLNESPEIERYVSSGELSLFHTSSESEPRSSWIEKQYITFYNYCRSGLTEAYAEPWASSTGEHGSVTDDRVESMPQWFYWRLLLDLHCGVSFIAIYGSDLNVALSGIYKSKGITYHDDTAMGTNYKGEFLKAMQFASKYAGYHASPITSPGAWVAFRGNTLVRNENGLSEAQRKLSFFTGDYSFLMSRAPDNSIPVEFIGSPHNAYGSWARKLPAGEKMILTPNTDFLNSLEYASLKIIRFDQATNNGSLRVTAGNEEIILTQEGHETWKENIIHLKDPGFSSIELEALNGDIIIHMVEIIRNEESTVSIPNIHENNKKPLVYTAEGKIFIEGIERDQQVEVYTSTGVKISSKRSISDRMEIPLKRKQIYIVKTGNHVRKVLLF